MDPDTMDALNHVQIYCSQFNVSRKNEKIMKDYISNSYDQKKDTSHLQGIIARLPSNYRKFILRPMRNYMVRHIFFFDQLTLEFVDDIIPLLTHNKIKEDENLFEKDWPCLSVYFLTEGLVC